MDADGTRNAKFNLANAIKTAFSYFVSDFVIQFFRCSMQQM